MSDELLPYYNRELAFFRRSSADFAEAHPKIAGRLRLGASSSEDPHVERLIEAFAYLNARIRHKLDDDFPEITDALLSVLYPHYLAPLPSMAIVQMLYDATQGIAATGYEIPRGTPIESEPVDGEPCRFRTCYPVQLWPMTLTAAQLASRPAPAPETRRSIEALSILRLELAAASDDAPLKDFGATSWRFYLEGLPQHVNALYELLMNNVLEVVLATSADDPDPVVLPSDAIQPVGFDRDEGMLPYDARSLLPYRILSEYFAFPEKFLFFDLTGLSPDRLARFDEQLHVFVYLNRTSVDLEQNVTADTFRLGCTPIVNLFRQRAEPIQLTQTSPDYRVAADARRPLGTEIYSVDNVVGQSPDGDEVRFVPFYSIEHADSNESTRAYWYASRRSSDEVTDSKDRGTEVYLTLVDLDAHPAGEAGWFVDVETTCLNRDLPNRLPYGGDQPALYLSEGAGPVERVSCLTPPTATRRTQARQGAMWRLVSHLTLDHRSITGEENAAAALREILKLYDSSDSPDTQAKIASIASVSSQRVVGRVPGQPGGNSLCRGIEIRVDFDADNFSENGLFLFASVVERFLGLYCSLNSFSRMIAQQKGRDEPLRRWPPRAGERTLL